MSKSKGKNFRLEDYKYSDGYGVDARKEKNKDSKRKERRFFHAIKTKDINELLESEDDYDECEVR